MVNTWFHDGAADVDSLYMPAWQRPTCSHCGRNLAC
jgi:hypothetical protein